MTPLRIRSILVATDLGQGSTRVLRQAGVLARSTGASLHLLHVVETPGRLPEALGGEQAPAEDDEAAETARESLTEQLDRALSDTAPESREVRTGTAHEEICARADETGADLIVLGPNRDPDMRARFLGTTAERVLRGAAAPCLVVRAPVPVPPRRIGVPTDLSESSMEAVALALQWVALFGAEGEGDAPDGRPEVRVMHAGWTVYRDDDEAVRELIVEPMERQVAEALERTGTGDQVSVRSDVVWENRSADAVVAWAERDELELLVMGSEGRGGVKRALLGSVTSSVARRAPCSILVAPSPPERTGPET